MESLFENRSGYLDLREIEEILQEGMIRDIHRDRLIWVDEPNPRIVEEYSNAMLENHRIRGQRLHRVIVYAFRGYYFIINGNHRAAALCKLDFTHIPCVVIKAEEDFQFILRSDMPIEHLRRYSSIEELHQDLAERMISERFRGYQLFTTSESEPVDISLSDGIHYKRRK